MTFGIGYRIFCVVVHVLLLVYVQFDFLEIYSCINYSDIEFPDGFFENMKIVITVIYGLDIAYNIFFRIWYQIKFRNSMKEEENSLPMTQVFPQSLLQAYAQIYPEMQKV